LFVGREEWLGRGGGSFATYLLTTEVEAAAAEDEPPPPPPPEEEQDPSDQRLHDSHDLSPEVFTTNYFDSFISIIPASFVFRTFIYCNYTIVYNYIQQVRRHTNLF